jgi:hypothetical protein
MAKAAGLARARAMATAQAIRNRLMGVSPPRKRRKAWTPGGARTRQKMGRGWHRRTGRGNIFVEKVM